MTGHAFGQQQGHYQHGLFILHVSREGRLHLIEGFGQAVPSVFLRQADVHELGRQLSHQCGLDAVVQLIAYLSEMMGNSLDDIFLAFRIWLYSSMVGTAGPAAVGLQLVLVRIQVNWHGQFLTQYLQLSVEMILRVLEEAKHQQVCDVLSIQARAVADLRVHGTSNAAPDTAGSQSPGNNLKEDTKMV